MIGWDIMNIVYKWMSSKKPIQLVIKCRKEGDFSIVYGKTLEICYLNKTSGLVLSLCNGKNSIADIRNYMLAYFEVEASELEDDLVNIIRDLQWKQMVVLEE